MAEPLHALAIPMHPLPVSLTLLWESSRRRLLAYAFVGRGLLLNSLYIK